MWMRSGRDLDEIWPSSGRDLAEFSERLNANANLATVLGSTPGSSGTVESEWVRIKHARKTLNNYLTAVAQEDNALQLYNETRVKKRQDFISFSRKHRTSR
jgi:hypothetical protein